MTDYNLIDRITALKLEFESGISSSNIFVFKSIFNILKNNDQLSSKDIRKAFKKYIKIYPCEGIDNEVINSIARNRPPPLRRPNIRISPNQLDSFSSIFPNLSFSTINTPNIASYGFTNLLTIPEMTDSNVPLLLKEEELDKLNCMKYKDITDDNKDKACIFKQSDFKDDDNVVILKCNHVFCEDEIKKWLTNVSYKCPTCREAAGEYYAKLN